MPVLRADWPGPPGPRLGRCFSCLTLPNLSYPGPCSLSPKITPSPPAPYTPHSLPHPREDVCDWCPWSPSQAEVLSSIHCCYDTLICGLSTVCPQTGCPREQAPPSVPFTPRASRYAELARRRRQGLCKRKALRHLQLSRGGIPALSEPELGLTSTLPHSQVRAALTGPCAG